MAALIKTGLRRGCGHLLSAMLCLVIPPKMAIAIGGPSVPDRHSALFTITAKSPQTDPFFSCSSVPLCGIVIGGLIMKLDLGPLVHQVGGYLLRRFCAQQLIRIGIPSRLQKENPSVLNAALPDGSACSSACWAGPLLHLPCRRRHFFYLYAASSMDKSTFVGTIVAVFFLSDALKIGVYWKMKL
jgi:hypothetical protein